MSSESETTTKNIIYKGVEMLSDAIRRAFPEASIEISAYGKYKDIETCVFGDDDGTVPAQCLYAKTDLYELVLVVSDDTCRRNRRGDDVETKRHAMAGIVGFKGPAFLNPEDCLMTDIRNNAASSFLVGAYGPGEKFGDAEPSNPFVYTMKDNFCPFLEGLRSTSVKPSGADVKFVSRAKIFFQPALAEHRPG